MTHASDLLGAVPYPKASTPFPNILLDTTMPSLTDTEWRVLCVVVRQTLGWRHGNTQARKGQDWLTQGQLKKRTGRASAALARAIDGLVRRGLIEVVNEDCQPLETPAKRRRALGRLYYRLGAGVLDAPSPAACSQRGVRLANTTKQKEDKNRKAGERPARRCRHEDPLILRSGTWTKAGEVAATRHPAPGEAGDYPPDH